MDDRTWYLAVGVLGLAVVGLALDAALSTFEISPGFWGLLTAMLGFLGGRAAIRARKNGNGGGVNARG